MKTRSGMLNYAAPTIPWYGYEIHWWTMFGASKIVKTSCRNFRAIQMKYSFV